MKYLKNSSCDPEPDRCPSCGEKHPIDEEDFGICMDCRDAIAERQEMYREEMGLLVDDELNIIGTYIDLDEDENDYRQPVMKHYKADISVKRVGITTAPRIPPDHPNVRFSSCLHREVFPATDITQARQRAIALVKDPNTPEFLECLDFYFVPFKILEWEDWQDPIEPEGETQIHSCESHPFLVGVFKWIIKILVYEE